MDGLARNAFERIVGELTRHRRRHRPIRRLLPELLCALDYDPAAAESAIPVVGTGISGLGSGVARRTTG